jgi:small neutral amino acid transporter SnatA (MarC family)
MHGTLEPIKLAATRRHATKARIIALAVVAGIVAGALLVYTPLGDQLFTFFGITDPKDCG